MSQTDTEIGRLKKNSELWPKKSSKEEGYYSLVSTLWFSVNIFEKKNQ